MGGIKWGGTCSTFANGHKIYVNENNISPGGCLSIHVPRGYIHVYDHTIQTSSLKPLGQSKPNSMWNIERKGERKFVLNGHGHITKMAVMAMYSKDL